MGAQRQLNALLFELQTAPSALERARILARAWRTVRDLSASDRRLLARHAGFDGAEHIVEGLGQRRGGVAPALLLRALTNARSGDGAAFGELVASLRDPTRRGEALELGLEAAAGLLREPEGEDPAVGTGAEAAEALADEGGTQDPAESALAALHALDESRQREVAEQGGPEAPAPRDSSGLSPAPRPAPAATPPRHPAPPRAQDTPSPTGAPAPQRARRRAPAPGWTALAAPAPSAPGPARVVPRGGGGQAPSDGTRFDAGMVLAALGAEDSLLSRLLVLHRELDAFRGSSTATLRDLVLSFPDGWPRRRALAALLRSGVVASPEAAVELAANLERELDRLWCLGLVAARGELSGAALEHALELLTTSSARRRLARG